MQPLLFMGVRNLWPFLEPSSEKLRDYKRFQEKVVAIDFSLWIYQLSYLSNISNNKFLMHINLFYRLCKLIQYQIKPIFVFDSSRIELKRRTSHKRYVNQRNQQKRKFADTHKKLALKLLGQIGKYQNGKDNTPDGYKVEVSESDEIPLADLNPQSNKKKIRYLSKNKQRDESINSLPSPGTPPQDFGVGSEAKSATLINDIAPFPKEKINQDSELIYNFKLLISAFGFPFLNAPGEAEAQCAYLQRIGSADFIITDDSDIFLYGGNSVCRNFFKKSNNILLYNFPVNDRSELIFISLILGNDYFEGIRGMGLKSAGKVLSEIKANIQMDHFDFVKALDYLINVYKIDINRDFILNQIYPAFFDPLIKKIGEDTKFKWEPFDKDKIRTFLFEHTNWDGEKISKELGELKKLERLI